MTISKWKIWIYIAIVAFLVSDLAYIKYSEKAKSEYNFSSEDYYETLAADTASEDPLKYINEDFTVKEGFYSNLPLVVLELDEELPDYKEFDTGAEIVYDDVEPWGMGTMELYETQDGYASLKGTPSIVSKIRIKRRGHTSYDFDKLQYGIKLIDSDGEDNPQNLFGMGSEDEWVLNGSMADKSMMRNYLAYRTASKIMEYAPKSCFCEVFSKKNGTYVYEGVYLMMDAITKSESRVNIESSQLKRVYTSYLVRRDRFTKFDTMLETYGRIEGYDPGYIGVKYPPVGKQSLSNLDYIADDFSKTERVIYSKYPGVFKNYENYIDTDSFVDYFLINEYFGNYDAGEHSTYMYKDAGAKLKIGPVWDFDQAMNNSVVDETDPLSLAMQDKTFYEQLCKDTVFIDKLKKRYSVLRISYLNDDYMFKMIDETERYLKSARAREWYRYSADYLDGSGKNHGNYYLGPYEYNGEVISRFNDNYDQELYNIKVYLSKHGSVMQERLTDFYEDADVTSGIRGHMTLLLAVIFMLFLIPSIIINRR